MRALLLWCSVADLLCFIFHMTAPPDLFQLHAHLRYVKEIEMESIVAYSVYSFFLICQRLYPPLSLHI